MDPFGAIFGGIGSIAGSFINAGNQARANDIAETNSLLQAMLGGENIRNQRELGNRSLNIQEDFGNRNFKLQRDTAEKNYDLADREGTKLQRLIESLGGQALDLKKQAASDNMDLAKSSKFDAFGNEVYYDPVNKAFKIRLAPNQQKLMDADQLESLKRSTEDQSRARRGLEQNERNRNVANDALTTVLADYRFGPTKVNEGQLANELYLGARGDREDKLKTLRDSLVKGAMRTNNSSSIDDISRQIRSSSNADTGDLMSAKTSAMSTANTINNQDRNNKQQNVQLLSALSRFAGDPSLPELGTSSAFDTTTKQADYGAAALSKAILGGADTVGNEMTNYGSRVGGVMSSRANAMINALTNGAASQGGALQAQASGESNAINNLMSALSGAYTSQASGIGSALGQEARLAANSKLDLSGFGKIGTGIGGLISALNKTDEGGVTSYAKSDRLF